MEEIRSRSWILFVHDRHGSTWRATAPSEAVLLECLRRAAEEGYAVELRRSDMSLRAVRV